MSGQAYYTDAGGTKRSLPVPNHHHDSAYISQASFDNRLRHYYAQLYQTMDWTLPNNVDVNIGSYTAAEGVVEWESAEAITHEVQMGWTSSGVVIPRDGAYHIYVHMDMTGNSGFDSTRFILGPTRNSNTFFTTLERAHVSNSMVRDNFTLGYLTAGDVISARTKLLSGADNLVRGLTLMVASVSPANIP